jgi:hypothetical protein
VGTWEIGVTWDDVPHLTAKDKAAILKDTPAYLRDARSKGVPLLGSGGVFTIYEDDEARRTAQPDSGLVALHQRAGLRLGSPDRGGRALARPRDRHRDVSKARASAR